MIGSVVAGAGIGISFLLSGALGGAFAVAGFVAIPLGIGVAVLRYRLFDIDRIISRTLAYAIVTGVLVGVYAGIVLLATRVVSITTPVAVAASTVAAFAARLQDTVDLDSVRDELAGVVQQALEPAHVALWLSSHSNMHLDSG